MCTVIGWSMLLSSQYAAGFADVMGLDMSSEEDDELEDEDQFDMAEEDEDMAEEDDVLDSDEEDDEVPVLPPTRQTQTGPKKKSCITSG